MALQFSPLFPVRLPAVSRKIDPLIKCIKGKNLKRLLKLMRGRDINGLYPYEEFSDDVTLLTAAVICSNEEICSYLLGQSADPNIPSTNELTPLHYAALTPGVPLSIVKRLLAAKADPDGHELQRFTPLQCAVDQDREDIVKALIEAGASPEENLGMKTEHDEEMERIIYQLSLQSQVFKTVHLFFTFSSAVQTKTQMDVLRIYKENFMEEHPFIHNILFELYINPSVQEVDEYRESAIKWLKDTNSADKYIDGVIERFPRIPQGHWLYSLDCLFAALRVIESVSPQVFSKLVPILTNRLQHYTNANGKPVNQSILAILNVIMQKTSEQKLRQNYAVYETLCKSLLPLTRPEYSSLIRVKSYGLFIYIYDIAPEFVELSFIPETILNTAEIEFDEVMKRKLHKLDESLRRTAGLSEVDSLCEKTTALSTNRKKKKKKKKKKKIQPEVGTEVVEFQDKDPPYPDKVVTSIEGTNSREYPFTQQTVNSRRWHQTSLRWRNKLEKLANIDESKTYRLSGLTLVLDPEFLIAEGSARTLVFLGLRDDGTEVAVKRMDRFNYQVLKNEEEFLRLPELDSPSIVRYVDFAEDAHFGYLVLQLCEYTLEEYIQDHLPEESAERSLVLKKLVKEVLCSLQVLHDQQTKVLHRDIKPQNVLIDIKGKARLADFGISRRLKQGETTLQTSVAGTKCWKAKEAMNVKVNTGYKRSSDIQVAGMLVYYILSGGHHPFGEDVDCEGNILRGRYSLDHLDDDVAKDLVEWMINENPEERPTVEQSLTHPFFWSDERRVRYLNILGNEKEAENCRNADEELLKAAAKHTEGKSFAEWKSEFPSELVQKLDGKKKAYPENTLGLLRFIRNLHEHYKTDALEINLVTLFPDLFASAYIFAKERGWNDRETVQMVINSAS